MIPNVHPVTGISYGVINANDLDPEVLNSISFDHGLDVHYINATATHAQIHLDFVIPEASENETTYQYYKRLSEVLSVLDGIEDFHQENEEFTGSLFSSLYEETETLYDTDSNTVTVLHSPNIGSFARCSPCYPGAGDLNNPAEYGNDTYNVPDSWKHEI